MKVIISTYKLIFMEESYDVKINYYVIIDHQEAGDIMYENKLKLYNIYNSIFDNQINKYLELSKMNDKIPRESFIFLESAKKSINNCLSLIENDEYIDSLCLLRSSFEAIMFSTAIYFDKKTYNMYKCYDKDIYTKVLKEKYKKEKQKNPNFKMLDLEKERKEFLKPYNIRKIVANNYKCLFNELFIDCKDEKDVLGELNDFYKYLCDFTHPSIVKTYVFKIQNDEENLNNIRTVFKLNINYCKILLILALNYFSNNDDMSDIYDLYAIIFLLDINLIDNVDNLKSLLKKYDEYLYLNITRKYFNNNKNKIKELQAEIKELDEIENLNKKLVGVMKDIIVKFDALKLFKEYF